jgi:hypothetical protein
MMHLPERGNVHSGSMKVGNFFSRRASIGYIKKEPAPCNL